MFYIYKKLEKTLIINSIKFTINIITNFSYVIIVSLDTSGKLNFVPQLFTKRNKVIQEYEDKARARESMVLEEKC